MRGQEDLFLQADVLEQTQAELSESRGVDILRVGHGALEQDIETLVVAGKVTINFSWHNKYLSMGPLNPSSADIT